MIQKQGDGITASAKHGLTTPISWTPEPDGHSTQAPASMCLNLMVLDLPWVHRAGDQKSLVAAIRACWWLCCSFRETSIAFPAAKQFLHQIHDLFKSLPCISLALCLWATRRGDLDITSLFFLPSSSPFMFSQCLIKKDRENKHQPQHPGAGGCWDTHTPTLSWKDAWQFCCIFILHLPFKHFSVTQMWDNCYHRDRWGYCRNNANSHWQLSKLKRQPHCFLKSIISSVLQIGKQRHQEKIILT